MEQLRAETSFANNETKFIKRPKGKLMEPKTYDLFRKRLHLRMAASTYLFMEVKGA